MKIWFISTSRYPTEKAYGVTIGESCAAANRLGHDADILTIGLTGADSLGNKVLGLETTFTKWLRRIFQRDRSSYLTEIAFVFSSILFALKLRRKLVCDKPEILWARDILLVAALKIMKYRGVILLEIHHMPNGLNTRLLRYIAHLHSVVITTLTANHKSKLEEKINCNNVVICPMGVPSIFFLNSYEKFSTEKLVMGYVGKATSSGHDNGLGLLFPIIKGLSETDVSFVFQFIGLENDAVENFQLEIKRLKIPENYVEFIAPVNHTEVPAYLHKMEIGFVPYPNSPYNSARFPIKIPEYAAAKCAIFASDTPAHRAILNDSMATFYSTQEKSNAIQEILKFIDQKKEFLDKVSNASEWVKDFTYDRRIEDALQACAVRTKNEHGLI